MVCKFWLAPVALAANHDFSARELNVIRTYIEQYLPRPLEAWDESHHRRKIDRTAAELKGYGLV